jgi:hypothetical protein
MIISNISRLWHTFQGPLAIVDVSADIDDVRPQCEVDLGAIVGPAAELETARLLVEREPADVDCTRADVDAQWHPVDYACVVDDNIGGKLAVYALVSTAHSVCHTR